MILYINNEHCSSVEQLKRYFNENLTSDSDIYNDLLDYGRYGDIAVWLREMGESEMASRVESISGNLGDSAFFAQLKAAIVGMEIKTDEILKPSFDQCFSFEGMKCDMKDNEAIVTVSLKILMCVNEKYELYVSSNWGTCAIMVNPFEYMEGKTATIVFTLSKKHDKDIGNITVMADEKEVFQHDTNDDDISVGDIKFKMIRVEGGTFTMGEGTEAHQVTLSTYYIGEAQVTQAFWKEVMGDNPSHFKGDNLPVEFVSWDDCQRFIKKLNQKTSKDFRLPTEAEWEFAARGGNKSQGFHYSGSNNLDEVAWYNENSGGKTHPIKTMKANELGIYDMNGNVWEWCSDWDESWLITNKSSAVTNPIGPTSGSDRVCRGGCWNNSAWFCGSANRRGNRPARCSYYIGFRLALSPSK